MSDPKTDEVLIGMLRENTGRRFLDSGGAYGRNWERNQSREFINEPETRLKFALYGDDEDPQLEIDFCLNVFSWLRERVTFNEPLQAMFDAFDSREENQDRGYLAVMDAFVDHLRERGYSVGGIYSEGEPLTVNTYNSEDALSQTLQYVYLTIDSPSEFWENDSPNPALDGDYLLLQIHGGCDVRGGYTAPKCFTCSIEEYSILDNARGGMWCERDHEHRWDTDNAGCSWHDETYPQPKDAPRELGGWPVQRVDAQPDEPLTADEAPALPGLGAQPAIVGFIGVDEHGNGYCPYCGGKLSAGAF